MAMVRIACSEDRTEDSPFATPLLTRALLIMLTLLMLSTAVEFQFPTLLRAAKTMTDLDAFYVAGLMYWDGVLNDAYHFPTLHEAQRRFTGTDGFMPWTYPPPFNLVTGAFAALPIGVAYLLFIGTSFLAYVLVLRRIAGGNCTAIVVAIFPAVVLNIRSGQNGFLTGALLGIFLLSYLRGPRGGGVALGVMIVKPHLAIGSAVLALVDQQWRRIATAAVTAVVLLALSALVFGAGIFPAFFSAMGEAGRFLALGFYPMFRMTSLYATLYTAGASPELALAVQVGSALMACTAIAVAARRCDDRRQVAAIAAFGSLLISPYNYDYDLTILGVSGALLWPRLALRARPARLAGLIALCWLVCGWGLLMNTWKEATYGRMADAADTAALPSMSSVALVALLVAVVATLRCPPLSSNRAGSVMGGRPGLLTP